MTIDNGEKGSCCLVEERGGGIPSVCWAKDYEIKCMALAPGKDLHLSIATHLYIWN